MRQVIAGGAHGRVAGERNHPGLERPEGGRPLPGVRRRLVEGVRDRLVNGGHVLGSLRGLEGMIAQVAELADGGADVAVATSEHVDHAPAVTFELSAQHFQPGDIGHRVFDSGKISEICRKLPGVTRAGRSPQVLVDAVTPKPDAERGRQRSALGERGAVVVAHGLHHGQPQGNTDAAERAAQCKAPRNLEIF